MSMYCEHEIAMGKCPACARLEGFKKAKEMAKVKAEKAAEVVRDLIPNDPHTCNRVDDLVDEISEMEPEEKG